MTAARRRVRKAVLMAAEKVKVAEKAVAMGVGPDL